VFSRDARAEVIRDGVPAIDLVNGQEWAGLLKRYELGVKTVMVEKGAGGWGVIWGNLTIKPVSPDYPNWNFLCLTLCNQRLHEVCQGNNLQSRSLQ